MILISLITRNIVNITSKLLLYRDTTVRSASKRVDQVETHCSKMPTSIIKWREVSVRRSNFYNLQGVCTESSYCKDCRQPLIVMRCFGGIVMIDNFHVQIDHSRVSN